MRPYTDIWKLFSSSFGDILRKICHAREKTSHTAILVRLGLLPPHYYIACHAMADFFTIASTTTAPANRLQVDRLRNSTLWNKTLFYAGAERNITYFQKWSDQPLMQCKSRRAFRRALERAMFAELTEAWAASSIARHTFTFVPTWKPQKLPLSHFSTTAERTLIRCCFAHNDSRTSRHFGAHRRSTLCRHCNSVDETIQHLCLRCSALVDEREKLKNTLPKMKDENSFLQTVLLDRRYAIPAQRFVDLALPYEDSEIGT